MTVKSGFALRQFGDRFVAVALDDRADTDNILITLNRTAAAMWELLETDTDYDTVLRGLLDRFDADEAVIRADLDRCLEQLRKAGILDE